MTTSTKQEAERREFLGKWYGHPDYSEPWPDHFTHAFSGWLAARATPSNPAPAQSVMQHALEVMLRAQAGCIDMNGSIAELRAALGTASAPKFDQAEFDEMVERGTKAWAGVPDGIADELPGGDAKRAGSEPYWPESTVLAIKKRMDDLLRADLEVLREAVEGEPEAQQAFYNVRAALIEKFHSGAQQAGDALDADGRRGPDAKTSEMFNKIGAHARNQAIRDATFEEAAEIFDCPVSAALLNSDVSALIRERKSGAAMAASAKGEKS